MRPRNTTDMRDKGYGSPAVDSARSRRQIGPPPMTTTHPLVKDQGRPSEAPSSKHGGPEQALRQRAAEL
jgi:hypothetical protein